MRWRVLLDREGGLGSGWTRQQWTEQDRAVGMGEGRRGREGRNTDTCIVLWRLLYSTLLYFSEDLRRKESPK